MVGIQSNKMNEENGAKLIMLMDSALRLGVLESLQETPKTIGELCENISAVPSKLERVLFALESIGMFQKNRETDKWEITPKCIILGKFKDFFLFQHTSVMINSFSKCLESLKVTKTGTEVFYGVPFFQALHKNPSDAQSFYSFMRLLTQNEEDYTAKMDLENVESMLDVGGGNGALMYNVLKRYPHMRVGVFETPDVAPMVSKFNSENEVQIEVHEGDFFVSVAEGYDSMCMKLVIHNWTNEDCIKILKNCRAAMSPGKPLFIIDDVIDRNEFTYTMQRRTDMIMMALLDGKERTEAEFTNILNQAGFELHSVTKAMPKSIVKAVAI